MLETLWDYIKSVNKYIDDMKPWVLKKENKTKKLNTVLYNIIQSLKLIALFLYPVMPETANKIYSQIGLERDVLKEDYKKDPVHLIADEMLGIQIASYIGGSRALFEFERFDKMKPGILKNLPPFLDDVIGGLVSGVLVKICSDLKI